nr:glycoside hydrolase family 30 beta sandwich domain-containing protein [Hufsiella arboris]
MLTAGVCSCRKKSDGGKGTIDPPVNSPSQPLKTDIVTWMTSPDQTSLLQKMNLSLIFDNATNSLPTITVDTTQNFQAIDGFGYTLTGGSATLLNSLNDPVKDDLLKELFLSDSNRIGVSYLRISIGASDLSAEPFTYDDIAYGQQDLILSNFSIERERKDMIPILKKIIQLNPNIKILGSPWSAPLWMKDKNSFVGGSLKPEYYAVYANYLVKYIQAMKAEGIIIDAITPQNEPLHGGNNPSMVMQAAEQADFIGKALGPAFRRAGLATKIISYDHNADRPDYPIAVLNNSDANSYVDGSAFHLYGGDISALSQVHDAFPAKNVYFTEQWVGGPGNFGGDLSWHVENLIIGATRNWSKNVLEWNLASDPNYNPHTQGGCNNCLGALTIANSVSRNVAYYIIAHASKFVRPGSIRISSNTVAGLPNVAFKTPAGKKVLIVLNKGTSTQSFNIGFNNKQAVASLAAGAVATFVW